METAVLMKIQSCTTKVGELFFSVRARDSLFVLFPLQVTRGRSYLVTFWTLHTCRPLSGFRGVVRKEESVERVRLEAARSMGRAQTRSL